MTHFESFDSIDEMFAYMAKAEAQGNSSLTDEQRSLTWGSHWFRPLDDFVIFGYCFTREEALERETAASPQEEIDAGWPEHAIEEMAERLERGYLFGEAWSKPFPQGELGDTHRASAWPITAEQFETARVAGWDHLDPGVRSWLEPLWRSITERR